jgi:hypothetical protein
MIAVTMFLVLGVSAYQISYGISTSGNSTQTSSSTLTSSTINITFDLPTAAVVTFVLILLGLSVGLLLMMRLSQADHSPM